MLGKADVEQIRSTLKELGAPTIFDPVCARFRSPALAQALVVWRDKAGAEGIPRRRDMSPMVMRAFLHRVSLFERVDQPAGGHRYRARLTGSEFVAAYAEMSGRFFDEVVPAGNLARWNLMADSALAHRAPYRLIALPQAFKREHSVAEMLVAPLLDDADLATQILVVSNLERGCLWAAVEAEETKFLGLPAAS